MREGLHLDKCSLRFLVGPYQVCGECRRNYMALRDPVRLRAVALGPRWSATVVQRQDSDETFLHLLSPQTVG